MTRPTIEIYADSNGWIAHFPLDSDMARVMGTQDIRTAFTLKTTLWDVVIQIAHLNPGFEVSPDLTKLLV